MEKHRASWKAELWMRRKGHSLDRFQGSKKTPGTGDSQSLRRASSERVRPLDRQASLLDSDASVAPKLEKTKGATSEQGGQRSNHKDKAHKKGQHGLLKTLVNFLTKTGSEEQKERGEKKSKEKCSSPQDPKHLEACVDPPEPTFKKKDKERGDKKSKEKGIFPQGPEPLEALTEPPESTSKKKDKEKGGKKSKEKDIFPQGPEPLEALTEPPELTSKKKDKEKGGKKSKEKGIFPEGPEPLEASTEASEPTSKKKDKKSSLKKAFSFKKHGNEEAKKSSGLDSRSPETRRPTKPTFLPLCISHRPASLATPDSDEEEVNERWFREVRPPNSTGLSNQVGRPPPKEEPPLKRDSESSEYDLNQGLGWTFALRSWEDIIIQKIVAVLKEQGDKYNEKIKEDPNFKAAWDNLSLTSIQTLVDVLGDQEESREPVGTQVVRRYHLTNKFTGNTNHAVHRIMGWRDHTVIHTFGRIPYNNEQVSGSRGKGMAQNGMRRYSAFKGEPKRH
ncbi:protein BNIP5 [Petaurus breviceps papuanus]|uniref:protein BNIP5 n=1 Tax=Petaurus breviceps papuanus TaxID=3040969 RepID=UPI0036DA29A9